MKKIKILITILCVTFMALGVVSSAGAYFIYPDSGILDTSRWESADDDGIVDNPTCPSIPNIVGLSETWTQDDNLLWHWEEGTENTYFDVDLAGGSISADNLYLVVKDGKQLQPYWYIFDLNAVLVDYETAVWNGSDTLQLRNFWPLQGAISHVSICGSGNVSVPEPATLLLLGFGLIGLAGFRKK